MKYLLPIFSLTFILSSCFAPIDYSQPTYARGGGGPQADMPSEPGKCYAKCLIPDQTEIYYEELFMFTGNIDNTDAAIETIQYQVTEPSTKWVKKKADKNCLSDDPEDCLVWCLVEVPAEYESITVVTDTTTTREFQVVDIEKERLVMEGGYTEWREVICEKDIDHFLVEAVQTALQERGFYNGTIGGKMNNRVKEALVAFQTSNGHPVGQLDVETLDGLGITY